MKITSSMRATPTRMNRSVPAWICDMKGRIPAVTSAGRKLLRKVCNTQKMSDPSRGPKTVAAPPRRSAVQTKNVSDVTYTPGLTAEGRAYTMPPAAASTPPSTSDCIL